MKTKRNKPENEKNKRGNKRKRNKKVLTICSKNVSLVFENAKCVQKTCRPCIQRMLNLSLENFKYVQKKG